VVANFYLNSLIDKNVIPKILRADRGTENSLISGIQPYLRDGHSDSLAREKSFMHGKSTSNQRIERFWGHVRKNCAQFWMNLFKNMIDRQLFDNSNPIHIDCIRYCFMDLIQQDLNKVVKEWNLHPIRKQKNDGVLENLRFFILNLIVLVVKNVVYRLIWKASILVKKFTVKIS
jgi:hypothetical protein